MDSDGFTIDELAGNVASNSDRLSIAYVKAAAGTAEPWLTLHYDEWMCVRVGKVVLSIAAAGTDKESILEVPAGKTVHIAPGTRFRPSFPVDTEYIPVCLPAFRPDRCIREDTTNASTQIANKLLDLHGTKRQKTMMEKSPEILYHMTTVAEWEAAKQRGVYYPKTFEQDGHYTHATGVPSRLLMTANHFYQDVVGDWICVRFTRTALRDCGIHVRDEEAMPVGDKQVSDEWGNWVFPHVIGGIPVGIIDKEFAMKREGTRFVAITGLVE